MVTRVPKVYCVNNINIDLTKVEEKYGPVIFLSHGYINVTKPMVVQQLNTRMEGLLEDSTEDDYVLLLGFSLATVLVTKIWFSKHSRMKVLIHQRIPDVYVELLVEK